MPEEVTQNPQRWLIVVLIYANFTLKKDGGFTLEEDIKHGLNEMFKDIIQTPLDVNRTRLYVFMSSTVFSENNDTKRQLLQYEIINDENKCVNEIRKFNVDSAQRMCNGNITHNGKLDFSIQKSDDLGKILKQVPVRKDEEILFITWDHGSAFGIFKDDIVTKVEPFDMELGKFPFLKLFLDEYDTETLSEKETLDQNNKLIKIGSHVFSLLEPEFHVLSNDNLGRLLEENIIQIKKEELDIDIVSEIVNTCPILDSLGKSEINIPMMESIQVKYVNTQTPEILTNSELANAISYWLPDKQIGVMMMMNCYMMNVHTMYSMRKNVQCLVAAQGAISNPGYNFKSILEKIRTEADITSTSLAKHSVYASCEDESALERAKKMGLKSEETIDTWSIFAINLQAKNANGEEWLQIQINAMNALLRKTIEAYKKDPVEIEYCHSLKYLFHYIRSVMYDFSFGNCMIDILDWAITVRKIDNSIADTPFLDKYEIRDKIQDLKNAIHNDGESPTIIHQNKTKSFFQIADKACITPRPYGYSLFFPLRKSFDNNANLIDYMNSDELLDNDLKSWKEFIEFIYKIDNKPALIE